MPRAHPQWGADFDWLGVDIHGHAAVFSSSGYGPVPVDVNLHAADVDGALDLIRRLPANGSARNMVRPSAEGDYSAWYSYSRNGFYAYDWRIWDGPYQRLSSPIVPVRISELPMELRAIALH